MAIDPLVLAKQRAVVTGQPEPLPPKPYDFKRGCAMTDQRCPRCRIRRLAKKNTTGICYRCWTRLSANQRDAVHAGVPIPWRTARRADADTIERARRKLAAKGITVEAA